MSLIKLNERLNRHYSLRAKANQKVALWDVDEIEEELLNAIERKHEEVRQA